MTPLQKIKQGILEQRLDLISEGYTDLTGEVLAANHEDKITSDTLIKTTLVTHNIPNKNKDIFEKKVITIDQPELPRDPYDIENFKMQVTSVKKNDDGRQPCRSEPININKIKTVGNMFTDDKEIKDEGIAKINDKINPTKRSRKNEVLHLKLYKCQGEGVDGRGCDNEQMLNPILVPTDRYVCSNCVELLAKKHKK